MKYKARTEINTNDENPTPIQRIELNSKDYNLMRKTNINKVLENKNEPLSNMTQELLNLEDDKAKLKFLEENCNKII